MRLRPAGGDQPRASAVSLDSRNLLPAEVGAVMRLAANKVPTVIGVDTPLGYSLLNVQAVNAGESLAP